MRCLGCKYDLSKLSEHRCPECGRAFDPSKARTFETPFSRKRRHEKRATWIISVVIILLLGVANYIKYNFAVNDRSLAEAVLWVVLAIFGIGVLLKYFLRR